MNDRQNLKKEYIELKCHMTPDLWERIEAGLEEKPDSVVPMKEKKYRSSFRWMSGVAAAGVMICISASFLFGRENSKAFPREVVVAEGTMAAETGTEAQSQPKYSNMNSPVIEYESISLAAAAPVAVPEQVKTVDNDLYFSEAILGETELLIQAAVEQVGFEYDSRGVAVAVTYEVVLNKVLYAEEYATPGSRLTIKSIIDEDMVLDGTVLYALLEGRTYLLPLAKNEDVMWLIFPFAPQIEVTNNGEYLFHNGWKSLVTEESMEVLKKTGSPHDFFYDRMMLRTDFSVEDELVSLTETMAQNGRNYDEKTD